MTISASYLNVRGVKLARTVVYELGNSASSTYHGASLTLNRRMNDELEFSASYTLSKTYDDASDYTEEPQNPGNLAAERSLSLQQQQQRLVFNGLWELPIGDEEAGQSPKSDWVTKVFGHLELAPILTAGSGRPANPLTGIDNYGLMAWPPSARPAGFGRNSLLTPGIVNLDFRVLKYLPFGPAAHLDVVAEAFNLLNSANVARINPVFGPGALPLASFLQPLAGAGAERSPDPIARLAYYRRMLRAPTPADFLRILGLVYLIAFVSLGMQAPGLLGSHGILPVAEYLDAVRQAGAAWEVPTVLWLSPSDAALAAVWILGALCSLAAVFLPRQQWQRIALGGCLLLWLSLCSVGQDFLSFQWDMLLLEAGFLALFADDSPIRVWLFRWLIFRLMFSSGIIKLLSHDSTWRGLTALSYHYETQPLPTPAAWYLQQLPMAFQKASTLVVLIAEIAVPFLFFLPGRFRRIGAWITIGLQFLILITGNYTYFNWLTIALAMWLFIEPGRQPEGRHRVVSIALAAVIGVASGLVMLELFSAPLPPGGSQILRLIEPLRIVNTYGLFASMTTTRLEIIVEGSSDGQQWQAYEFPYKPGDLRRPPPVVAPLQPRLDWQMWFAALGSYQENRWFVNFIVRLLHGEPRVTRLLSYNPFPKSPPKYIRARLYLYHFSRWGERAWWTREERGLYLPAVSLQ